MSGAEVYIPIETTTDQWDNQPCWCAECGWDGVEDDLQFTNEGVFVCPQCSSEDTDYYYSEEAESCVFCGSDKVVGVIDVVSLNEIHPHSMPMPPPLDKEQVYGYCARCADVKMAEGSTGDQIISWEDGAGVSSPSMPPTDIKWAESKKERIASGRPMHYAIPSEKKYPIWDKAHARMALSWSRGTKYADKVEKAVSKRFPSMAAETVYRNYPGRKGPSLSATSVKRGTRKRGNDGNMWEVRKSGKSQRWFRGAESFKADEFIDGMGWDEWMDNLDYGQQDAREFFLASRLNDETGAPPLYVDFTTHNGVPADFFIPKLRGIPKPDDDPIWKPYTPSKIVVSETRRCTTLCPNCSGEVVGRVFGEDDLRMKCWDCGWANEASADDWEWPEEWGEVVKEAESFEAEDVEDSAWDDTFVLSGDYVKDMEGVVGEGIYQRVWYMRDDEEDDVCYVCQGNTDKMCMVVFALSDDIEALMDGEVEPSKTGEYFLCEKHIPLPFQDDAKYGAESFEALGEPDAPYDQGYDDQQDESLGERNITTGEQSLKDRRDEADAMDKKTGRKYHDVGTMDSKMIYPTGPGSGWGSKVKHTMEPTARESWKPGVDPEFSAEEVPVVPDPSSFPSGSGRVLGQQTDQANLSPLHAESFAYESGILNVMSCALCGTWEDDQDSTSSGMAQCGGCETFLCIDCDPRKMRILIEPNGESTRYCDDCSVEDYWAENVNNAEEDKKLWTILLDDNYMFSKTFVFDSKKNAIRFRDAARNSRYLQEQDIGVYNIVDGSLINEVLSDEDIADILEIECLQCGDGCYCDGWEGQSEGDDVQKVKIQDPVTTGAKLALGVVALNATAIAGAALIGLAISHTARKEE